MDDPTEGTNTCDSNESTEGTNMDIPTETDTTDNGSTLEEPSSVTSEDTDNTTVPADSTIQDNVDGAAEPARDLKANILNRMRLDANSNKAQDPMWQTFFDTRKNIGGDACR